MTANLRIRDLRKRRAGRSARLSCRRSGTARHGTPQRVALTCGNSVPVGTAHPGSRPVPSGTTPGGGGPARPHGESEMELLDPPRRHPATASRGRAASGHLSTSPRKDRP